MTQASMPQCACITTDTASKVSSVFDGNAKAAGSKPNKAKLNARSAVHNPAWLLPAADCRAAVNEIWRMPAFFYAKKK